MISPDPVWLSSAERRSFQPGFFLLSQLDSKFAKSKSKFSWSSSSYILPSFI